MLVSWDYYIVYIYPHLQYMNNDNKHKWIENKLWDITMDILIQT